MKLKLDHLSPQQRAAAEKLLEELGDIHEANPLYQYQPYEKQRQFHAASERTRAFFGGNRTGKTTCAVADDLVQVLPPKLVPDHLLPYKKFGHDSPAKVRVITPDLTETMEAVLEKFREMVPPEALRDGQWDKAFDKQKRNLWFNRGDRINFMSTEQDANKFGGQSFHRIHFDEEPAGTNAWKIYRDSRMRLIDSGGDMVFSMTPLLETDWVEEIVWDQRGNGKVFAVRASMLDNPYLSKEEIEEALADLTDEERKAIEHGEFVHFAGLFYPEFGPAHHHEPVDRDHVKGQTVIVGIDPGLNRTGVVYTAFDKDNVALVFDELYPAQMVVEDVAELIKENNTLWGVEPYYVIDPSARNRSTVNADAVEAAYARAGIYTAQGQNDRGAGILEVKRRLQHEGLYVAENCRNLMKEFRHYRRDENTQDEFRAVKKDDHLLDALRYACMERTWTLPPRAIEPPPNRNIMVEPPWTGQELRPDNPPLGAMS